MTNFIFKSSNDLQKISQQIKVSLAEQRQQRSDLAEIKFMIHKLLTNKDLQTTVDKFYEEAPRFDDEPKPHPEDQADLD